MKNIYKSFFVVIVLASTLVGSCKKQIRCGCDGDVINTWVEYPVYITYNEEANSASFTFEGAPMAQYYICNPTEIMSELVTFDQNEKVIIDCEIYYECNYMMQASNSYYSYWQAYMVVVDNIQSSLYGND